MAVSSEVLFNGYKISAHAQRYTHEYWTARFVVEKDGKIIRKSELLTCRNSKVTAESGALLMGIQYVDLYLMPAEEIEALHAKAFRRTA